MDPPTIPIVRAANARCWAWRSTIYQPAAETPENLFYQRLLTRVTHTRLRCAQNDNVAAFATLCVGPSGRRLLRSMVDGLYPSRIESQSIGAQALPYLLKGLNRAPNQVWSIDITYIRLQAGCLSGA